MAPEAIYALGIVIAGQSLITAKPLTFALIVAALIVVAISARALLRTLRRSKSGSV